jgi:IS5 family transposase
MHQKKGNQWHFGMKARIAVDAEPELMHTVTVTAANAATWNRWLRCCTATGAGVG